MTNSVTLNDMLMEWSVKRAHSLAGPQNLSIDFNTKWNILEGPKVATSYSELLAFHNGSAEFSMFLGYCIASVFEWYTMFWGSVVVLKYQTWHNIPQEQKTQLYRGICRVKMNNTNTKEGTLQLSLKLSQKSLRRIVIISVTKCYSICLPYFRMLRMIFCLTPFLVYIKLLYQIKVIQVLAGIYT